MSKQTQNIPYYIDYPYNIRMKGLKNKKALFKNDEKDNNRNCALKR